MATKEFFQKILRNPLQALMIFLAAFFITFIINLILTTIDYNVFNFYMESTWANVTSRALIPSAWGWFEIIITIAAFIGAFIVDRLEIKLWKIELTWILMAGAGVFLQLILTGIYVKIIW
ncbi:MAG: hypothetical protein LUQ65_09385 [Candidatus Helarchaeota archaeon]|nr:hypothetical protein [Candidatus Helarchaeota archaeon]